MTETTIIQAFTSDALGLSAGKPILIPFTLEGEKVEITKSFKKKGMRFAQALSIIQPSKHRIEPFCPHFTECGGCLVQHLEYEQEILWKEKNIKSLFSSFKNLEILPLIKADRFEGWRNKMEFSFSPTGELGLYRFFGKRDVFDTKYCSLGPRWFQEAVDEIRSFSRQHQVLPYDPQKNRGSLRSLTLRHGHRTGDRMLFLTLSGDPKKLWTDEQLTHYQKIGESFNSSLFLVVQKAVPGLETTYAEIHLRGKNHLVEKLSVLGREFSFHVSPRAFFQPNPLQAEKLYQKTFDLLQLKGDELLLDLFAGTGTLGIFGAPFVKKVISVELSKEACMDARVNRKLNGITNLEILQGDVGKILHQGRIPSPDVIIVDPPRAGLSHDAIDAILKLQPKKIGYISCNPVTQVNDISRLVEFGYLLKVIQPVDQFPRSPHVENIAFLEKAAAIYS